MAIKKSKETASGVTGEYWRIYIVRRVDSQSLDAFVILYKDAAARTAGKDPILQESHTIPHPSGNENISFSYCYAQLKQLPDFSGAEDI